MNYELFTAFVLITVVLIITPGPVVTLVIATGATHGVRAALTTVLGTTIGNAILIAFVFDSAWAIAAGLGRAWFMAPSRAKLLGRLSGAVLIGGGIWLSLARRPA